MTANAASDDLKSYRFRQEREADWKAFETLLTRVERDGPKGLSGEDMLALPRLYRSAVSSLSTARSISLDQGVTRYLEDLCTRGYIQMYGPRVSFREQVDQFFRIDWPQAVASARGATLLAALCLLGAGVIGFVLVMQDVDWFYALRGNFEDARNPEATVEELRATLYTEDTDIFAMLAVFASQLFTHNTMVALLAFALGFALGVPTALLLIYNGLVLGAFVGLFTRAGLGFELIGWLLIHGVTELFAIILAGAAGFLIGKSIAFPGQKTRLASAASAGKTAGTIGMGLVVMLLFAALLEGFGRQLINSDIIRYVIAGTTLLMWLAYFYLPRGERASNG